MALLEISNFIHFLGLAFGLGGATIAAIISAKAEKDKDVRKAIGKILPSVVKLIWVGIIFLIISGVALIFLVRWPLNKNLLIIKLVLVAWIVIIGIIIGKRARKRKSIKGLSIINLILWYVITLISTFV